MSLTDYLTELAETAEDRKGGKKRMTVIISERHVAILDKLVEHFSDKQCPLASKLLEKALEDAEGMLNL